MISFTSPLSRGRGLAGGIIVCGQCNRYESLLNMSDGWLQEIVEEHGKRHFF
jgi:hypothetical protein